MFKVLAVVVFALAGSFANAGPSDGLAGTYKALTAQNSALSEDGCAFYHGAAASLVEQGGNLVRLGSER